MKMLSPYPHLLKPIKVGKFILKNRMQSSNSMPHFSQGPERYPADPIMGHYLGRSKNGAAFVTFCSMEDDPDSPTFPDWLVCLTSPSLICLTPSVRTTLWR